MRLLPIFFQVYRKIDKHNFVVVLVDGAGKLVTNMTFIQNTKIMSSKMGEDKDRGKHREKTQVRCISHMEMQHVMLKYSEVVDKY